MAAAILVEIGAKNSEAIKGINDVSLRLQDQRAILKQLKSDYASLSTQQVQSTIGKEIAADIKIAQSEIKRLSAVSTSSFGEVGKAAGVGYSALRKFAYVIPGLGIAGIVGLLGDMAVSLFTGADAFSKAEIKASLLKDALDELSASMKRLDESLSFQTKLADIDFRIKNGQGAASDINNLRNQIQANNVTIKASEREIDVLDSGFQRLKGTLDKYTAGVKAADEQARKLGTSVKTASAQLILSGKDIQNLTADEVKKLPKAQREFVTEYQQVNKSLTDLNKKRSEALQQNAILEKQILLTQADEQRKLREQATKDYEKYINDTISLGKKLASYFEGRANIRQVETGETTLIPRFNPLDTKAEMLDKANKIISAFNQSGNTVIEPVIAKVSLEIQPVISREKTQSLFRKELEKLESVIQNINLPLKVDVSPALNIAAGRNDALDKRKKELLELQKLGEVVGNSIANAFGDAFSEIAKGQNAFKALGKAIQQVVTELIKAAIQAFIVRQIVNLFAPGLGSLSVPNLALPGRAAGGPVSPGQSYIVGESGREVFVPSTSGRIVPGNDLGNIQGAAQQQIIFNGDFAIRGDTLRLILSRTDRRQFENG